VTVEPYHFEFMAEAIREAEISIAQGGLPIGAVLTRDRKIIARGHNRRVQEQNVILHGEMSCMRNAGLIPFHDTVMYTTLSPCSMCAGAIGLFKLSLPSPPTNGCGRAISVIEADLRSFIGCRWRPTVFDWLPLGRQ